MNTAAAALSGPELDPRHLVRFDADPAEYSLAVDHGAENVFAGRHVAHGEVLTVGGVGMVVLAVRLGVAERRLLRLGLHDAVDARLRHRPAAAVPHLPRDDSRAGHGRDPQLRIARV